jgi:hypothetical protein
MGGRANTWPEAASAAFEERSQGDRGPTLSWWERPSRKAGREFCYASPFAPATTLCKTESIEEGYRTRMACEEGVDYQRVFRYALWQGGC